MAAESTTEEQVIYEVRDAPAKSLFFLLSGRDMPEGWESLHFLPRDYNDIACCMRMLDNFPELRYVMPSVAEARPRWKPYLDAWPQIEELYRKACALWAMEPADQKEWLDVFAVNPYDELVKLIERLEIASLYMGGMRAQGTTERFRFEAPKNYAG
jgi:hypothetical protein